LLILCSIVMAIDRHATLLRESAATPGNDLRLGACEAPPAIISIYLGSKICGVLDRIERGEESEKGAYHKMQLGAPTLSAISSDFTDRNRTSPFAFTSNRFEFRMLPSSISISSANVVLNTIVAEAFDEVATRLENASDVNAEILNIIREIYKKHKRVIFNGNGYCNEWVEEAEKRGLPNITNMVDAIPVLVEDDTVKMFEKYRVYSKNELFARKEIKLKEYMDTIFLEASTMLEMTQRLIFPAAMKYQGDLARNASHMDKIGVMPEVQRKVVIELEEKLSAATKAFDILKADMDTTKNMDCDSLSKSKYYRDVLVTDMANLRTVCDALERIVGEEYWPYPRYNELLFNI